MRKIVIPTDFSENAMNAIRYAVELFKYEKSTFFILHAFADEVYDKKADMGRALFKEVKEMMHENSDEQLDRIRVERLKISPNPKHEYKVLSKFGNLIDETNDLVDQENADIVVMGTKGQTNDRNLTFGSNALQIIKYVKCPVMAIPQGHSYIQPKRILFPTDYLLPYKRRELKLLDTISKSFRSEINFLYASEFEKLSLRQEDNKAFLEESLPGANQVFHNASVASHRLIESIHECIEENKMDMLVMVNSRHSYLENMLYHSAIDTIGLKIKIPFLVMQNLQRT